MQTATLSSAKIETGETPSPSPQRNMPRIPLPPDSIFMKILQKLQGTNIRMLSPRLAPLLPFEQQNVTNIASPDLLSFFEQNNSISLPSMLQTLGYSGTEATLWMSVVGEASGASDILRQLQQAYKMAESDDNLQHSRIAVSTDGQSVAAEEPPYSLEPFPHLMLLADLIPNSESLSMEAITHYICQSLHPIKHSQSRLRPFNDPSTYACT